LESQLIASSIERCHMPLAMWSLFLSHKTHLKRIPADLLIRSQAVQAPTTSDVNNVTDVGLKDVPLRSLFPDAPVAKAGDPKLKVAIVGSGLAGLSTAVELLDQGYEVEIYESRPWIGGKVASFQDKDGNHIEMGLHVFFGCYFNLFRLMAKCGVLENLLLKDHTHTFCNTGGDVRELDFRFFIGDTKIGAPFHGLRAFFTTPQLSTADKIANSLALGTSPIVRSLIDPEGGMQDVRALDNVSFQDWFKSHGGSQQSIDRMWDPIAYALGFLDCKDISARCMLSIFQFFATKTDASALRMLNGSPADRLLAPIADYIKARGGKIHTRWGCREVMYETGSDGKPSTVTGLRLTKAGEEQIVKADAYVAALDVPGAKRLIPEAWRDQTFFDNIFNLVGVPVITVQLRYDGWVTEMNDPKIATQLGTGRAYGINNLLYSADADFSCFADLALTSPVDYYKEGEGSLMQCVLTPADPYLPKDNESIAAEVDRQVKKLFPSAKNLNATWHSIVKIGQSLYREAPGMDPFRPDQRTPIPNFFLAGSYTKQDYIDSMEGATLSGRQCAYKVLEDAPKIAAGIAAAKQTVAA
jgi:zeta-carotene desaturase